MLSWLEENMFTCPFKAQFGMDCLGCGMQRSMVALLRGEVMESLALYPALIPLIITFLVTAAHIVYPFRSGVVWIKASFSTTAALIVMNYLYKLFFA